MTTTLARVVALSRRAANPHADIWIEDGDVWMRDGCGHCFSMSLATFQDLLVKYAKESVG